MQLTAIEYVQAKSIRITDCSSRCLQRSLVQLGSGRKEILRNKAESDVELKYFDDLIGKSAKQRTIVEGVNLDHNLQPLHIQQLIEIGTASVGVKCAPACSSDSRGVKSRTCVFV